MLGFGFLRQKPIHKYIVDFYCPKLKLVIEIDGESHCEKYASDQSRENDLKALGLHVLRFSDRNVKRDLSNVLWGIQCWIEQHLKKDIPLTPLKGGMNEE
jgi:very-short-patch-repair endonuclease